jgi:hypothetical protein
MVIERAPHGDNIRFETENRSEVVGEIDDIQSLPNRAERHHELKAKTLGQRRTMGKRNGDLVEIRRQISPDIFLVTAEEDENLVGQFHPHAGADKIDNIGASAGILG